jgi:nitrilase
MQFKPLDEDIPRGILSIRMKRHKSSGRKRMNIVRVAVVQDSPVVFNLQATLEKVYSLVNRAAKEGAKLVVLPEAFVSAYPAGLDFGARIGSRTPEGREDFRRYYESAVEVVGPACDALGKTAQDARVFLIIGVIERDGGTLYCTVLFFSPDGELMGKHRKLMPTGMERLVWGFGDGSTLPVFDTPLGKIGSVICWENYMPMLRMHMYAQRIQLYCAPTADSRDTWLPSMRHIALEGRCFVLSCCQYLTRADCPKDYAAIQGDDPATILMRGGSCIIGPLGQVLAGPNFAGPSILTADLDLDEIPKGKYDFDVVGHYSRPDIFRLHVNTRPTLPVVVASKDAE